MVRGFKSHLSDQFKNEIMTIFKYSKDGMLYTLSESRYHYYGQLTAIPYNRSFDRSFIVKSEADRKRFTEVAYRN